MRKDGDDAKTLLVACSTLLLTLTLGPVTAASARSDAFRGTWTAIDVLDGSNVTLTIQGSGTGGRHAVKGHDDAVFFLCNGAPGSLQESGSVDGVTMEVLWTLVCHPGGNVLHHRISDTFTYHPGVGHAHRQIRQRLPPRQLKPVSRAKQRPCLAERPGRGGCSVILGRRDQQLSTDTARDYWTTRG
jgi:hypothetical protein